MKRPFLLAVAVVFLVVLAVAFWPAGRKSGPEPFAYGKDACSRCRMIVSEKGFGGEARDAAGRLHKFDDVGCLLAARAEMAGEPEVWVEDHESGAFVPAASAHFVAAAGIKTPMGHGIVAFADAARAAAFAAEHSAAVTTFDALRKAGSAPAPAADAPLVARPGEPRPLDERTALDGKQIYLRECSACHGERGDGEGPAAAWIDPKPRNFLKGIYKLRSTDSGQPPATADVLRTIERGIPGTAMPAFTFLTPEERRKLAAYVLYLGDLLDRPEPQPIPDPGAPPPAGPESVAKGKAVYEAMQCGKCHGPGGKGDGPSAAELKDDAGQPIPVRDFTAGKFRGGAERTDLYYRFVTGMDGTPMPSYADSVAGADRWALVDFVMSLRVEPKEEPLPADPIQAGRRIAEKYSCRGCHVLDDGKGGEVGPDLRISGQKLSTDWIEAFLPDPRAYGKIYPWRVHRMPHLGITKDEARVLARYISTMGKRKEGPLAVPEVASFPAERLQAGKNYFLLRCTECHNLGTVIECPPAKQQGPDLIRVANRVDFEWAKKWILDPKAIDPKTKMTNPGITPADVEAVRMFVWKTAVESGPAGGNAGPSGGTD